MREGEEGGEDEGEEGEEGGRGGSMMHHLHIVERRKEMPITKYTDVNKMYIHIECIHNT